MTYWLAYNKHTNALVGLSDNIINPTDDIIVLENEGEMPDMSRLAWNSATLDWYAKPIREISKLEYMNRFTDQELAAIYTVAKTNVMVEIWLEKFKAVKDNVNLDDPRTVAGVHALEAAGLLGSGRASEILG